LWILHRSGEKVSRAIQSTGVRADVAALLEKQVLGRSSSATGRCNWSDLEVTQAHQHDVARAIYKLLEQLLGLTWQMRISLLWWLQTP